MLIFVRIPAAYTIYSIVGLGVFGLYTVIDFNRLRRAGTDQAIPLAAGIFLDVLNIFLFFLRIFGRGTERRLSLQQPALAQAPQARGRIPARRHVLEPDPAVVADRVERAEHRLEVDLPGSGIAAPGVVGELHVRDLARWRSIEPARSSPMRFMW